jgi:hypothetical protein
MKTLLKELINPNTAILNDTQKAVLVIVQVSPTPEVAYENTVASENLSVARNTLLKLGALRSTENALELTTRGKEMLEYHNLVDETGELSEEGNEVLEASKRVAQTFNNQDVKESFRLLSKLNNL